MPEFPIVDAHVHLYDPGVIRYGWMGATRCSRGRISWPSSTRRVAPLRSKAWCSSRSAPIPASTCRRASYVAGLAERDPRILAMVAHAPLERGAAVTPDLEKLAADELTRAIRRLLQDEPDPEFCLRPGFVEGVQLLQRFDLACDLCVRHHQLPAVIELVRRCPGVRFILDHIGKPAIRDNLMDPGATTSEN